MDLLMLALAATILTYVWRLQDLYPVFASIKLPVLGALGALGFYLLDGDRRRTLQTIKHPITTMACVIMTLAVLSVPTSVHDGMSFRFIRDDLGKNFLLMIILAASVRSFVDLKRYAVVMLAGAFLFALNVQLFAEIGESGRLGDLVYYDSNDLGMLLVSSMPVALFFVIRGRGFIQRAAATLTMMLFAVVIVKTGSRGAFLGLLSVALYILFRFRSVSKGLRIGAIAAGFAGIMLVGSDKYWDMMSTLLHPKDDYNWAGGSETGRMDVWGRGMGYMFDRPFTGVGVNAFGVAEGTISELAARQQLGIGVKWSSAHNSFVQIGAELGVFGLLAFILVLWRSYKTASKSGRPPTPVARAPDEQVFGEALAGAIIGYAVSGFFLSQAYGSYNFALFGLIVGLAKITAANPGSAGSTQPLNRTGTGRRRSVPLRRVPGPQH